MTLQKGYFILAWQHTVACLFRCNKFLALFPGTFRIRNHLIYLFSRFIVQVFTTWYHLSICSLISDVKLEGDKEHTKLFVELEWIFHYRKRQTLFTYIIPLVKIEPEMTECDVETPRTTNFTSSIRSHMLVAYLS